MDSNINTQFAKEVKEGLSADQKHLSSKWFYDERGDDLFVKIMSLPEYYLTRSELEIFRDRTSELKAALTDGMPAFDLIELGAGDGTKTMHLLAALDPDAFTYRPVDISSNALEQLSDRVRAELPSVKVVPLQGEYFEVLSKLESDRPKIVLFMGSNIGNLLDERANAFLKALSAGMRKGDRLLMGLDLKKSKDIILPAYNDAQGVTAAFNLNVLRRINKELGGNFDLSAFEHIPEYNESDGIARSFIRSKEDQTVEVTALDLEVQFSAGELIFTEVSRKYDDESIARITDHTDLDLQEKVYDSKGYFCDAIFEKV
jgi:dimethylhistidine N-methyltransferase